MADLGSRWRVPQLVVAVAALVALGVGVPVGALLKAQVGSTLIAQDYSQQPPPSGGSYTPPPDSGSYTPPPSYTPPQDTTCSDGSHVPMGSPCPQPAPQQPPPSGSQPPAGSQYPSGSQPQQCGSGAYWDMQANTCKPMTSGQMPPSGQYPSCPSGQYWDEPTHVCKTSSGTPGQMPPGGQTPPAGQGGQCDWSKQYWDQQSQSCKANTGSMPSGQMPPAGQQYPSAPICQGMTFPYTFSTGTSANDCASFQSQCSTGTPAVQQECAKATGMSTMPQPGSQQQYQQPGQQPGQQPYPMPMPPSFGDHQDTQGQQGQYQQSPYPFPGQGFGSPFGGQFPGPFQFPGQTPFGGFPGMMPPGDQGHPGEFSGPHDKEGQGQYQQQPWMPPDFSQGCYPGDPTCAGGYDPRKVFEKFQGAFDMGEMGPPEWTQDRLAQAVNMRKREAKETLKRGPIAESSRMLDRINKMGNGQVCEAGIELEALVSTIKPTLETIANATVDTPNIEEELQKMGTIMGELMPQFGEIMPKLGMCEGKFSFAKETARAKNEVERECKRLVEEDNDYKTLCDETIAALDAEKLFATCSDEYGVDRPCVEENFRSIMENFWPQISQHMDERFGENLRENVERMAEEIRSFLEGSDEFDFPEEMRARAEEMAPVVLDYLNDALEEGTPEAYEDAMRFAEQVGRKMEMGGHGRGRGRGRGEGEKEITMFNKGANNLVEQSIQDALAGIEGVSEEVLNAILERVNGVVKNLENTVAILQAQVNDLLIHVATITEKYPQLSKSASGALDAAGALPEDARKEMLSNRQDLAAVTSQMVSVADALPKACQAKLEHMASITLTEPLTEEASNEAKTLLDNFATYATTETDAKALKNECAAIEKKVAAIAKEDVSAQVKEGTRPFADVPMAEYYAGPAISMKALGIVKGINGEFAPDLPVTGNEIITMAVRASGEPCTQASVPAAGEATWACSGTARDLGMHVIEAGNLAAPATRGEVVSVLVDTLKGTGVLDPDKIECDSAFKDVSASDEFAKESCILNALNVLRGDAATGEANLENPITRAEATTLLDRLIKATENPEVVQAVFE